LFTTMRQQGPAVQLVLKTFVLLDVLCGPAADKFDIP